ncbi:phycobilisome rod-core linker polypeptide [Sphaerospermopsis aphanizomenoides BCCUSP55]|uniref:phycobilisome rod-core linker polypeptide n=1 Tax=Sphaerospermopsis aphanizomenoides TaxID=459663 RepID=UPI001908A643|nr:phycobilisome rod-core linker polypeptide [Sphaerospermopsis aphanizomenoides]MBK1987847.1 phycobilisome rod-core linker polypeptide [Sphaerospermopsis aphanizomenoides BCCUSP55]
MTIPLLAYTPSSQNQRVKGFEVPGDETPRIYTTEGTPSRGDMDDLIWAAYRQIFNEQQILVSNRLPRLESQLKSRSLTVRDFIRGLATSDTFRIRNYNVNNNYRFVEMCVQRLLGRKVYNQRETMAWSIVLATKGLNGFIDTLLNSDEYQQHFGDNTVPYQRRRILPQHSKGELPFARMSRYGTDYRDKLPKPVSLGADGLFTQFEKFDFQTFKQRADWNRASIVLLSILTIIVLFLLFSETNRLFLS